MWIPIRSNVNATWCTSTVILWMNRFHMILQCVSTRKVLFWKKDTYYGCYCWMIYDVYKNFIFKKMLWYRKTYLSASYTLTYGWLRVCKHAISGSSQSLLLLFGQRPMIRLYRNTWSLRSCWLLRTSYLTYIISRSGICQTDRYHILTRYIFSDTPT